MKKYKTRVFKVRVKVEYEFEFEAEAGKSVKEIKDYAGILWDGKVSAGIEGIHYHDTEIRVNRI